MGDKINLEEISIVISLGPNRERQINQLLNSIQNAKKSELIKEIIIVCDNSVNFSLINSKKNVIIYKSPKHINIPEARNIGIKLSTENFLIFIDSDCILPKNYFKIISELKRDIYVGDFIQPKKSSIWAKMQCRQDKNTLIRYIDHNVITVLSCHFIIPKIIINKIGLFNEKTFISDEREWGERATKNGEIINYVPELFVYHEYSNRLIDMVKRRFWHGSGYHRFVNHDYHKSGKKNFKYWLNKYNESIIYLLKLEFYGFFIFLSITSFLIGYYYGIIFLNRTDLRKEIKNMNPIKIKKYKY